MVAGCSPAAVFEDTVSRAVSTRQGVDYSFGRPRPSIVRASGYTFAVRYVSSVPSKNLTKAEADALRAAGVDIAVVWEDSGDDARNGYNEGVWQAQSAEEQALADGMPSSRPIYFAVDYDAPVSDQPALDAYFDGVASVIGRARTGAYAGYGPLKRLFDAGKIAWGWQTSAWSNGNWDARAQLRQVAYNVFVDGANCDVDDAMAADFGQWGSANTDNCATAQDGAYCGYSTVDGFSGKGDSHTIYDCKNGQTTSTQHCAIACIINPNGADYCSTDNCANAEDGAYCGYSTVDGFSGKGDSHTIYDCKNRQTTGTQHCATACIINPSGADYCADNCATAQDGAYCGYSTVDGFSGKGDAKTIYYCKNHLTTGTTGCANRCVINPTGADYCG
jgi:hypothetical protein